MKTTSPYRTAEQLGLEAWEHESLVALVGPLSRGEIRLDMRTAGSQVETCGTVACIGGHMAVATGMTLPQAARYVHGYARSDGWPDGTLTALFFPSQPAAWACTAAQAGHAVVNFLTLGEPRWDDIMRG